MRRILTGLIVLASFLVVISVSAKVVKVGLVNGSYEALAIVPGSTTSAADVGSGIIKTLHNPADIVTDALGNKYLLASFLEADPMALRVVKACSLASNDKCKFFAKRIRMNGVIVYMISNIRHQKLLDADSEASAINAIKDSCGNCDCCNE